MNNEPKQPTQPQAVSEPTRQEELKKKLEKVLDKHFPDDMDESMYHPNLGGAIEDVMKLLDSEREQMKSQVREAIEMVMDREDVQPHHWSKSLESPELDIALDGLFWFKQRVRDALSKELGIEDK